jgi:hypothetical protein
MNLWEFQGLFKPVASHTSGQEFDGYLASMGRVVANVSRVVVLRTDASAL